MSLFAQFTTDPELEKEGVLLQYGTTDDGRDICIRVARSGGANNEFNKLMEAKVKPLKRQIQAETIQKAQVEKLMREVFCSTVVKGWENVEDIEGKPIAFNYDNALKLFTDLPDLFADVQEAAGKAALFRAEIRKASSGN